MARKLVPGPLRAAVTLMGACTLAVSVPTFAHADPGVRFQSAVNGGTADTTNAADEGGELDHISREIDQVRTTTSQAKATITKLDEKIAPLNSLLTDNAVHAAPRTPSQEFADFSDEPVTLITVPPGKSHDTLTASRGELDTEKQRLTNVITDCDRKEATLNERKQAIVTRAEEAERASRSGAHTTTESAGTQFTPPANASAAEIAIAYARAQLGKPYVFGAAGPNSFDCSGLTMRAWGAAGVNIGGHQTHSQWAATSRVDRSQLAPGDVVFFYGHEHVGLYLGNGQVIHAPTSGDVVKITSLDAFGGYDGAGRPC